MNTLKLINSLGIQSEILTYQQQQILFEASEDSFDFLKIHALGVRFKVLRLFVELEEKYYYLTDIEEETEAEAARYCRIRMKEERIELKYLNEAERHILDELYENYEDIY